MSNNNKYELLNYTGHPFVLQIGKTTINLAPSGNARVLNTRYDQPMLLSDVGEIPFKVIVEEEVTGLPEPAPDTYYIVSWPVARILIERDDLLIGDDQVVTNQGKVSAVRSLALLAQRR